MTGPWFVPLDPKAAGVRLFVFPHAGGGPASLAPLACVFSELGLPVEPWAVSLPGRQARANEIPWTDLPDLVDELDRQLVPLLDGPCALFGYCGGGLLSYLVARGLERAGRPPRRLIVGSAPAPDLRAYPRRLHLLPGDAFWDEVLAQGGIPGELAARDELRPLFEPALRADFALLAGYRHERQPPLTSGITVLHGLSDRSMHRGQLLGWRRQTSAAFSVREVPCSHWLVEEAPEELARAIACAVSSPT